MLQQDQHRQDKQNQHRQQQQHQQKHQRQDQRHQHQQDHQQQQDHHQQDHQQQLQQRHHHQEKQRQRATRKCCAFCAKRKRPCDGLRPRCSVCIDQNNPVCLYRQKHPTKARSKAMPAPHVVSDSVCSGAAGQAEQAQLTSCAGMAASSSGRSTSFLPGVVSLRRCRLSPSPATGLVGMQENAFLNDYFECLGFLPLASARTVRQAMVELMLGFTPQQREESRYADAGRPTGGQEGEFRRKREKGEGVQALAYQDRAGHSSTCIMWCAIALGALVQGCSLNFVAGYLQLARDSLAECFDNNTVQTARAYLVMSFLQTFLGDKETSKRYIAFAKSIVEQLPPGVVPSDMGNMLLSEGNHLRRFRYGYSHSGSDAGAKLQEESEGSMQIPAKSCVQEKDLCNFYFAANRRIHKAFFRDMLGEGNSKNVDGEGKTQPERGLEGQLDQFQEQRELGRMEGGTDGGRGSLRVSPSLSDHMIERAKPRGRRDVHRAGAAIKAFIKDSFSGLTRLLTMIEEPQAVAGGSMRALRDVVPNVRIEITSTGEHGNQDQIRSGKCSGVAGLLFHGPMAYMKLVKGDTSGYFRSVEVCARVLTRFPGICRYRPHTIHCVLAAAASQMSRSVYDPVRDVYNTILPGNGTPAPPLEEWGGMECICDHKFCRSMHVAPNDSDTASFSNEGFTRARATAAFSPPAPPSSPHPSPVTRSTRGLHGLPACEVQPAAASKEEEWTVPATPNSSSGGSFPPSDPGLLPLDHTVYVSLSGEGKPDVGTGVIPPSFSEKHYCFGGTGGGCNGGKVSVGSQAPTSEPTGEGVDIPVQRAIFCEDSEEGSRRSQTVHETSFDGKVPSVVFVRDDVGINRGVGVFRVPDRAGGLTLAEFNTGGRVGLVGNRQEGADDIRLTEQDFMDAAEVLISSGCPDEKLGGDTVGAF